MTRRDAKPMCYYILYYLKYFDFVFHLRLMLLIVGYENSPSLRLQRKMMVENLYRRQYIPFANSMQLLSWA